ncbi:MAG: SprB repeat-containing protein [Bacteroidetes bacterium]|nr:SprB repeat-containing protein [Bacteroidota bacterium]
MKTYTRAALHLILKCLVVMIALTGSIQLRGQSLVEFDASVLSGSNPAPVSMPAINVSSHLTSTALTRNNLTAVANAGAFTSSNWPFSPTTAPTGNKYLTFTLTAASGYVLNLGGATIQFAVRKSGTGPIAAYIYTSVGGFASSANALNVVTPITSSGATADVYTFPSTASYNNLFSVEIRVYADQASNAAGSLRFFNPTAGGNIRVTGGSVVSCVPVISNITSNAPICSGSTLDLSPTIVSIFNNITYAWTGPNSFSSSLHYPSIPLATSAASGTYSLTATNVCGSVSGTTSAFVSSVSVATSSVNESCYSSCNGSATATPSGGFGSYTYAWSPSGGTSATASSLCNGSY